MIAITEKTREVCNKKALQAPEVIDLLHNIREELQDGINNNHVRQLNMDTLDTRQKNALYNWMTDVIDRREHCIRTGQ